MLRIPYKRNNEITLISNSTFSEVHQFSEKEKELSFDYECRCNSKVCFGYHFSYFSLMKSKQKSRIFLRNFSLHLVGFLCPSNFTSYPSEVKPHVNTFLHALFRWKSETRLRKNLQLIRTKDQVISRLRFSLWFGFCFGIEIAY